MIALFKVPRLDHLPCQEALAQSTIRRDKQSRLRTSVRNAILEALSRPEIAFDFTTSTGLTLTV